MYNKSLMTNFELFVYTKKNIKTDDVALFSHLFEKMSKTEKNKTNILTLLMIAVRSKSYNIIRFLYARIGVGNLNKDTARMILDVAIKTNDIVLFKIFRSEFGAQSPTEKRGIIL